jgi:hypothetical protein
MADYRKPIVIEALAWNRKLQKLAGTSLTSDNKQVRGTEGFVADG